MRAFKKFFKVFVFSVFRYLARKFQPFRTGLNKKVARREKIRAKRKEKGKEKKREKGFLRVFFDY